MLMEKTTQLLQPYQLHYSDLISLSSPSSSSSTEIQRLESVTEAVMEALGPTGPGLLTITGVPNVAEHRHSLLPLARDLSLLPHHHRKRILKDHGLGSDVPLKNLDRCVSSFAMQLKYEDDLDLNKLSHLSSEDRDKHNTNLSQLSSEGLDKLNSVEESFDVVKYDKSMDNHFKDLSYSFRKLGLCMMDLGLRVARICDRAIGGKELENSLLESRTAKGRLIHYHSSFDTCIIKEAGQRKGSKKGQQKSEKKYYRIEDMRRDEDEGIKCEKRSNLWQEWHYDYGTFTILTSPMFIRQRCYETESGEYVCANFGGFEWRSTSDNTYLQIFHPKNNNLCTIKAPPESFILQVGESADILSRKKLQPTLHSVSRSGKAENLSRESFVVFLHPAWNKVFDTSEYPMEQSALDDDSGKHAEGPQSDEDPNNSTHEIHKIIPPLSARLKNGMSFAEFSRETTKQYYGGNGLQSRR